MLFNDEKNFYSWTRDLHLYLELFVNPFILIDTFSVCFLNLGLEPWSIVEIETTS